MWAVISHAVDAWSNLYSDSAVLRTLIGFAHVGGLLVGGGYALSEDRRILTRVRADQSTWEFERSAHGIVLTGLGFVMTSGMLLFAANLEIYSRSPAFWIKMGLVLALVANGWALRRAEAGAAAGLVRLRRAAGLSALLWLLTTLAGSVLPNV
jgi:hypothetical protein